MASQSRVAKCVRKRSATALFEPRGARLQFLKAGERGIEICFIEDFAAVD